MKLFMEKLKIKNLNNKEVKLPSNIEAEQALLGSVLVNNDIIDEILRSFAFKNL